MSVKVIIIVTVVASLKCSQTAAQTAVGLHCVPGCSCRQSTNPTSSLVAMNCSGDVGITSFSLPRLNAINISSLVFDLYLSNNSLTSIPASSFRSFAELELLSLRWNRLAVVKSGAFRGTALRRLDLTGNRLAAVRPGTFVGVESTLVELDLSWNEIACIDEAFVGLSTLSRLDLRHNRLASLTARSLRGLSNLRHLRLDSNLIAEVDLVALNDLSRLTNLVLRGNPLSVTRLEFSWAGNSSLSYVDLSECWLKTVPCSIPDTVTYLQLRRNNITRLDARR